jgi:filamentous hemagglutinin family protein
MKTHISISALVALFISQLIANPQGGKVVAGNATITNTNTTTTTINQSTDKAIINWQSYNIDTNEKVIYNQPSSNSWTLNRVISNDPSKIFGTIKANGGVVLVNQNGILFGPNSQIDVAKLVTSTHDITNENFLKGNFKFDILGKPNASIINLVILQYKTMV